jgi:hypothetical protein
MPDPEYQRPAFETWMQEYVVVSYSRGFDDAVDLARMRELWGYGLTPSQAVHKLARDKAVAQEQQADVLECEYDVFEGRR